eukprot:gnl/Trimastix_PCT/3138.p1 GENE.gnl/Trimastix_PCT/3138~~gnl/Trimastix_PCT/3138.p1  ORF type:complete len:270 (-),score=26.75 gnl/Trimastix_PCT/3138:22-831(-)
MSYSMCDNATRFFNELTALHAIFPPDLDEVGTLMFEDPYLLTLIDTLDGSQVPLEILPTSFSLTLPLLDGVGIHLSFFVPLGYPFRDLPECSVTSEAFTRSSRELCASELRAAFESRVGSECLYDMVLWAQENAPRFIEPPDATPCASAPSSIVTIERALLRFHHIINKEKRRAIAAMAETLGLAGVCKPGHPGAIVVEGAAHDVREYVARLRGLSWKKMSLLRTDTVASRTFPRAFRELPVDACHLREWMTEQGIGDLFKELIGILRS